MGRAATKPDKVNRNTVPRTKSPQFLSHIMVRRVVANTLVLRMSTFFFKNSLINFTSNSYHSKALFLFYNMVSNENKPPRKELTDAQRIRIIGAYECGVKGSAIVEQLGLPPSTVYDTIKRYNKTGSHTLKIALADQKSSMSAMNALWYALPILLVISPLPTLQGSSAPLLENQFPPRPPANTLTNLVGKAVSNAKNHS